MGGDEENDVIFQSLSEANTDRNGRGDRFCASRFAPGILAAGLIVTAMVAGATAAETIELNPATTTYDHHPSISVSPDQTTWVAWHTYQNGVDGVVARQIDPQGAVGPLHAISEDGPIHGPPTIIAESAQRASIFWSTKVAGRWQVMCRRWRGGRWAKQQPLSEVAYDAIFPTATLVDDSQLLVAWSARVGDHYRIRGRQLNVDAGTEATLDISGEQRSDRQVSTIGTANSPCNAYRPTLVRHNNEVWAFWDQYRQSNYAVHGRRILPTLGAIESISPPGEYCLTPTPFSHASGLHVAWLRKIDVIGGPGVISQWHTLHGAIRRHDEWTQVRDAGGKTEAAELTQGLMAKISPRPIATGGYLGSRVRPLWQSCGDQVWLLWERKSDHRGSTPKVAGDLVGRAIDDGQWQTAVVLQQGFVDYHPVHPPRDDATSFPVVASKLPRQAKRTYVQMTVDLDAAQPFEQDAWPGWSPITLPINAEQTPRRKITAGDKTYKLFWGDLHCHNNLSADAEGESDESNHYARDRAGLDIVVFTNNDFYNVPLTQYEYELGNLFAASHSVPGAFLSLPGYEWTSRIPGVAGASLGDPGNWLPPYRNRSFPNHRSVIYPPAGGPLVHFTEVENDIAHLNEAVANAGGITLSQHPAFELSGHPVEIGLELTSGWSNYIAQNPQLFHRALDRARTGTGTRLGFVANGDSHRRAPGLSGALTGIYAESLTPTAILDALRQRRCFATSGARILVDARADGTLMGGEAPAVDRRISLSLHAIGTRPLTRAVLIRDGQKVFAAPGNGQREINVEFTDEPVESGVHWYYWQVSQEIVAPVLPGNLMAAHGHLAWSSPHWVTVK